MTKSCLMDCYLDGLTGISGIPNFTSPSNYYMWVSKRSWLHYMVVSIHLGVQNPIDFVLSKLAAQKEFLVAFFFCKGPCSLFVEKWMVLLLATGQILNATGKVKIVGFFDRSWAPFSHWKTIRNCSRKSSENLFLLFFRFLWLLVSQYYHKRPKMLP